MRQSCRSRVSLELAWISKALLQAKKISIEEQQKQQKQLKDSQKQKNLAIQIALKQVEQTRLQTKEVEKQQQSQQLEVLKQEQRQWMLKTLDATTSAFITRDTLNDRIYDALLHPVNYHIPFEVLKYQKKV